MNNELNFKELYQVSLKATYPIEMGGNTIEPEETIALFDRIQIANFQEVKNTTTLRSGFDNRSYIFWESTKEIKINFTQGIFSRAHLSLMANAQLVECLGEENIPINIREVYESDNSGKIRLKYRPNETIFVYDLETGKKLKDWSRSGDIIYLGQSYKQVIIDYWYNYNNGFTTMRVGKPLTAGFLSLYGKTRVKDDTTGKVVTGIIKIPKLRLMSDLSMRVGSDAIPQVGRLDAVAVPEGARGQSKVMEIIFLNDDIDADM